MSLQQKLYDDLKQAFKEKKEPDLSTLRLLKSDIQYELTKTGNSTVPDEVILQLIKKNIARRRETAEEYKKAGREDLYLKETGEGDFLQTYLPPSLSEEEIRAAVQSAISSIGAKGPSDMGKVMGKVMADLKGKNAEGSLVSSVVKSMLSAL